MGLNETQSKAVEKHFNMLDEYFKETEFLIAKCRELASKLKQSTSDNTIIGYRKDGCSRAIKTSDIKSVKHWHTNSGIFYVPVVKALGEEWIIKTFTEYRTVCLYLGLSEPENNIPSSQYDSIWKLFCDGNL